ncbi:carbon-nitrogen hydrolase [Cystobasidium minutum MCA 4210]|uniref:carbon-nitrogen hydrolase n=1 Tax=Cystobasidium minutum MCA 4210 TaxID=1397322 RepID=UPI0034CDE945|eukprot:jgi/Rhomi1/165496/fgenesh1_kg.1_\
MGRPLRIALAQLYSTPNVKTNLDNLEEAVQNAAKEGCQLIVFPEYYTQGIVADSPHKVLKDTTVQDSMCELAKKCQIDIVIGTLVEHLSEAQQHETNAREHRPYNTAYYISKQGEILGRYRKRNLWHPEKAYLRAGEEDHLVFRTDYAKTGMLVCWDLAWPEAFRALFHQGVELAIVPTYWTADDLTDEGKLYDPEASGEKSWLDSLVVTRAYENECVVVFVNCGGPAEQGFLGRSAVAAPLKGVIGRIESGEAQLKIVDVDLDVIQAAKKVYQIREDYDKSVSKMRFKHH